MTSQNSINNKPDTARTEDDVMVFGTSGVLSEITLTDGELIIGNTGNAPSASSLTSAGATIAITDGAGTIDLAESRFVAEHGFLAYRSANVANVTGDGSAYTEAIDTEIYDIDGDYNNGTYTFTAPHDGYYMFFNGSYIGNLQAGHTGTQCTLNASNGAYWLDYSNAFVQAVAGNYAVSGNAITYMDASDTVYVQLYVFSAAKVVTFVQTSSFFNVMLILQD